MVEIDLYCVQKILNPGLQNKIMFTNILCWIVSKNSKIWPNKLAHFIIVCYYIKPIISMSKSCLVMVVVHMEIAYV